MKNYVQTHTHTQSSYRKFLLIQLIKINRKLTDTNLVDYSIAIWKMLFGKFGDSRRRKLNDDDDYAVE